MIKILRIGAERPTWGYGNFLRLQLCTERSVSLWGSESCSEAQLVRLSSEAQLVRRGPRRTRTERGPTRTCSPARRTGAAETAAGSKVSISACQASPGRQSGMVNSSGSHHAVHQDEEVVVEQRLAVGPGVGRVRAVQVDAERERLRVVPVRLGSSASRPG